MPLSTCWSGVVVSTLVALLLLPVQYYVPDLYSKSTDELETAPQLTTGPTSKLFWFDDTFAHIPPIDLFLTLMLVTIAFLTYIGEWIQRKIMERRLVKLNQYLEASVERLRAWDARQQQLEVSLKTVQNATEEYNLLLYLLLRQHRCLAHTGPTSNFFDKETEDELLFLRNPTIDQQ